MPRPLLAVVGPTATGKSDLALDVAEAIGGPEAAEIVNADAMQLYRGMDIGTAKLPAHERRAIAHHQLDVLEVTEDASVAAYQRHARHDVERITGRGRLPVVVGGSGLYVRALLDEISFPGTDPEVRARLEERAETEGAGILHAELARRDPEAAGRILLGNTRRIVRALEVIELTAQPFTAALPEHRYHRDREVVQVALSVPRHELDERIARRTAKMLEAGLVEETEVLLERGLLDGRTAARAVGYAQAVDLIQGRLGRQECLEAIALATRQLARRQEKWFRRDPRVVWIEPDEARSTSAGVVGVVRRLLDEDGWRSA